MSDIITIVGTVGTEPEKKVANGLTITTFRVGSRQRRLDRATGAWTDGETSWYTVSAYRKLAEHAFESLHKRDRVILTGRLKVRTWEAGEKRGTAVEIDVDAIGHDLLWGTSSFTQDERPSDTSSAPAADAAWSPNATSDHWPESTEDAATGNAAVGADADSEAVEPQPGAGDSGGEVRTLALAGVETPF